MKTKHSEQHDKTVNNDTVINDVRQILLTARNQAYSTVNFIMVRAYWLIGRRIVNEEQNGKGRARYGKEVIKNIAKEISSEFDKNFTERRVREIRQFYLTFPFKKLWASEKNQNNIENWHALSAEFKNELQHCLFTRITWSHIRHILRIENEKARIWYILECAKNSWSIRTLERNISSQYYERLLASQTQKPVIDEMNKNTLKLQNNRYEFIKNPTVLEFLNLPNNLSHTESQIEKAIIDNLRQFMLELGKGYAFVERQKLIRTEVRDYFIDLVFYNYILKCFVLIDLKTSRITHQDVGQMDMYLRMFDETIRRKDDNPTLGIVLCAETDHDIAKYSILKGNEHIFATKYKLYLPSEKELISEIERERIHFGEQLRKK